MARRLGEIFVELVLKDDKFIDGIKRNKAAAESAARDIEKTSGDSNQRRAKTHADADAQIRQSTDKTYAQLTRGIEAAKHAYNQSLGPQKTYMQNMIETSKHVIQAAPGYAIATAAITSVYMALRTLTGTFVSGLKAIEDYKMSVATMAGFITTFTDKSQEGGDIGKIYQRARGEATQLINVLEILDAKTIASGKDLRTIAEGFIKQGVAIDITNKETQQGIINIATAAKLLTAGQNQEIQLRQEIRALAQGQVKDSNLLVKAIEPMVPNIKQQIEQWKIAGTLIPELGKLFEGLGLASKDMEATWATIGSTLETTKDRILREGMLPIYNDLLAGATSLRDMFLDSNGALTEQAKILQGRISASWETLKNLVSIVWSIIKPFVPLFEMLGSLTSYIADGWGQLLAVVEPIFKRISANLSATWEGIKAIGSALAMVQQTQSGDIFGAKKSFDDARESWKKFRDESSKASPISLVEEVDTNLRKYYSARDMKNKPLAGSSQTGDLLKSNINILSMMKETNAELDKTINKEKVIKDKYLEMRESISSVYKAMSVKGQITPELEKEYRETLSNITRAENEELGKLGEKAVKEMAKKSQAYLDLKNKLNEEDRKNFESSSKTAEDYFDKLQTKLQSLQSAPGETEQLLGWEREFSEAMFKAGSAVNVTSDELDNLYVKMAKFSEMMGKTKSAISGKSMGEFAKSMAKFEKQYLPGAKEDNIQNQAIAELNIQKAKWDKFTDAEKEASGKTEKIWADYYETITTMNDNWVMGAVDGLDKYANHTTNAFKTASDAVQRAFKGMEDSLVEFVKTGKISFTDMVDSMVTDLIRLSIQKSITGPLATAAASFLPSLFGASANGNIFNQNGFQKFANGGAFTNSIVSSPTIFPFANGTGLMGEAGPEAIMPLQRNSSGKLGIIASGGGAVTNVIINNNTSAKATASETQNSTGGKDITVMIDEVVGNLIMSGRGKTNKAMRSTFGANPILAGR